MSTYVLVHGSWHGGWCWDKVVPLLEAKGHKAIALDLPGHGADKTPISEITVDSYAARVCAALDAQPEDLSWGVARVALPEALRALAGREPVRTIAGGNGRLPAALAERIRLRPGCEVVHVETRTDGVRLVYEARGRESGVIADAVVLAVPALWPTNTLTPPVVLVAPARAPMKVLKAAVVLA